MARWLAREKATPAEFNLRSGRAQGPPTHPTSHLPPPTDRSLQLLTFLLPIHFHSRLASDQQQQQQQQCAPARCRTITPTADRRPAEVAVSHAPSPCAGEAVKLSATATRDRAAQAREALTTPAHESMTLLRRFCLPSAYHLREMTGQAKPSSVGNEATRYVICRRHDVGWLRPFLRPRPANRRRFRCAS